MLSRRDLLRQLPLAVLAVACGGTASTETSPAAPRASVTTTTGSPPAPSTTSPATSTPPSTTTPDERSFELRSREVWGARSPVESLLLPHSGAMRYLTVHHAGDSLGTTGPERFRVWQEWHMDERGWGDLAYHYIIGVDGVVWTGREVGLRGDTATSYDPDRHFLVVVEGNFDVVEPTAAQLRALPLVLAWAAATWGVPTDSIAGHKDYAATACPGANLYSYVRSGTLRADVDTVIAAGGATVQP